MLTNIARTALSRTATAQKTTWCHQSGIQYPRARTPTLPSNPAAAVLSCKFSQSFRAPQTFLSSLEQGAKNRDCIESSMNGVRSRRYSKPCQKNPTSPFTTPRVFLREGHNNAYTPTYAHQRTPTHTTTHARARKFSYYLFIWRWHLVIPAEARSLATTA